MEIDEFIEGRGFYILTLTSLHHHRQVHSRQSRHLDYISQFTADIRNVRGDANQAADALFQATMNNIQAQSPTHINFEAMAKAQEEDLELKALQDSTSSSLQFATVPHPTLSVTLICDTSTGIPRPFVPVSLRCTVFHCLRSLAHPGIRATQQLISDRFIWPGMNADIRNWTRACLRCKRTKIQQHKVTPLGTFATPDARFEQIHIDIVGPLPPCRGYSYLLTCVDRFTHWPEAWPMPDITADTIALTFVSGWVARFGVPSSITTDRGRQFESQLWRSLTQLLGCKHLRTTSYHPSANGMVERFHRQLKAALKAKGASLNWVDSLPLILLSICTTLKSDLKCSAAALVYGTTLCLPGEFFQQSASDVDPVSLVARSKNTMRQCRATPVCLQPQHNVHIDLHLASCTRVHLQRRHPQASPTDIRWSLSCRLQGGKIIVTGLQWMARHRFIGSPKTGIL